MNEGTRLGWQKELRSNCGINYGIFRARKVPNDKGSSRGGVNGKFFNNSIWDRYFVIKGKQTSILKSGDIGVMGQNLKKSDPKKS